MTIYLCQMTLHDNVFFASREMGVLYETEKYLHNWALSHAFFEVEHIPKPYGLSGENAQKPSYFDRKNEQNLELLNDADIYVFPAIPLRWNYQINTFKAAQVNYYGKSKQFGDSGANRNYPINFGRAKELGVGSIYRTFIITPDSIYLPEKKWIRLGKWASKIQVNIFAIPPEIISCTSGSFICQHPLNPLDLPPQTQLQLYDRIVMPPTSLISQGKLLGDRWEIESKLDKLKEKLQVEKVDERIISIAGTKLPRGCGYGINKNTNAA
jgi:CRISPR-associated protein Csc1